MAQMTVGYILIAIALVGIFLVLLGYWLGGRRG